MCLIYRCKNRANPVTKGRLFTDFLLIHIHYTSYIIHLYMLPHLGGDVRELTVVDVIEALIGSG